VLYLGIWESGASLMICQWPIASKSGIKSSSMQNENEECAQGRSYISWKLQNVNQNSQISSSCCIPEAHPWAEHQQKKGRISCIG
jgi:hypothetical protein